MSEVPLQQESTLQLCLTIEGFLDERIMETFIISCWTFPSDSEAYLHFSFVFGQSDLLIYFNYINSF